MSAGWAHGDDAAAKPVTTVPDIVPTFVSVKQLDVCRDKSQNIKHFSEP